ncbi:MAG: hypothetical protein KDK76_05695 [Chlamydiia bacterium]|nr:hypothetical protein [Chlamydiia bacterium]
MENVNDLTQVSASYSFQDGYIDSAEIGTALTTEENEELGTRFKELPPEIQYLIFKNLPIKALIAWSGVNKTYRALVYIEIEHLKNQGIERCWQKIESLGDSPERIRLLASPIETELASNPLLRKENFSLLADLQANIVLSLTLQDADSFHRLVKDIELSHQHGQPKIPFIDEAKVRVDWDEFVTQSAYSMLRLTVKSLKNDCEHIEIQNKILDALSHLKHEKSKPYKIFLIASFLEELSGFNSESINNFKEALKQSEFDQSNSPEYVEYDEMDLLLAESSDNES